MNGFSMLIRSRKFWLMLLDIVISTATYFITKFAAPEVGKDVLWIIGSWQPVIVMLIYSIALEDAAMKGNESFAADPDKVG